MHNGKKHGEIGIAVIGRKFVERFKSVRPLYESKYGQNMMVIL